jgi:dihydrofolate reductase
MAELPEVSTDVREVASLRAAGEQDDVQPLRARAAGPSRTMSSRRRARPINGTTSRAGANTLRIVISEFVSLDGVVQAPGQPEEDTEGGFAHGGWSLQFFDPDTMGPALGETMERTEGLLFGRRTWQVMAAAWPGRAGDPFADRMNAIDKYVVSGTLSSDELTWNNSTLIAPDDLVAEVERLRREDGGDVQVMGSASLARTLISEDLVDEYKLMLEPIVLGGGKKLFPDDGVARPLELVSTNTSSTGVHICTYRPAA